ncbi:glycosyltransferase family 2 protein [Sporolactobacillus laevolacticus]|uniref:Bactoprenol glucosyl transferase n=1 Tax=Sporolactobacillus laevolacticus DSM 442 TaxID=1395513 RepID=V6IVS5_9BACL|nr:glycosyltransferase family 2 protein [Sporolactobacillus laevolacticus]EST11235.1 bactoprenol glucosyl transferase [Sporolactobacillus laevolacticus DSM 442]MDN3954952.1 glycosyltransferase family 2 protein [Sporolactobacillus laevolacticus]
MNEPILTIVVPCYNEEAVLNETVTRLRAVLVRACREQLISQGSTILFVDDGSSDRTWEIINQYIQEYKEVTGLKLSRNFGHQNALIAGMETATPYSDCVVTIDADLQDDVNAIRKFLIKYREGFDIVYGVRDKRETDTFFKRNTALLFYGVMSRLGVKTVPNHADFRLLSRRVLEEFVKYQEENIFLRGMIPLLGFKSTEVYYNRAERFAGESKYPLKKMLNFAIDGITSFSIAPIRMVTYLGGTVAGIGFLIGLYALIQHFLGHAVSGWTSMILSIWLIGGMQLIAIGVIGEYIGKIFKETKHRPRYIIEKQQVRPKNEHFEQKAL